MRYVLFVAAVFCFVLGLAGCNGERSGTAKVVAGSNSSLPVWSDSSSVSDVRAQKARAETLTLGGRREDGMHYIDYVNPNYMDVVIFTRRAQDYLRRNGRRQALDDFMNPDSPFVSGRMYVFAYDAAGRCLADWADPSMVGQEGDREFLQILRDTAAAGGGWVESLGMDPLGGERRVKESYVVLAEPEGIILGAGLFKNSL